MTNYGIMTPMTKKEEAPRITFEAKTEDKVTLIERFKQKCQEKGHDRTYVFFKLIEKYCK